MKGPIAALLDASIVFSFDRTGFRRHSRSFRPEDLAQDLAGKTALVTGANSGIGYVAARELARRGARVRLICRNEARGHEAVERLRREVPGARLDLDVLDVSDLAAIRVYTDRTAGDGPVDVLVQNAGVLPTSLATSPQGIEVTLATNVVGPYLLTRSLEPRLRQGSRVIFVSSGGMYPTRLSLADLDWKERPFDGVAAYSQTKRMLVVLSELLAERLAPSGVVVHAMHPGWADTPAVQTSLPRFHRWTRWILRTPEEGADTVVWLAVAPEPGRSTGRFWFDREARRTHFRSSTRESEAERRSFLERVEQLAERR